MLRGNHSRFIPATIAEAFNGDQISMLERVEPKKVDDMILILLNEVFMAHSMEATTHVLLMMVGKIKEKYWFMKLEEIAFVFQNGIMGFYKVYGKLTPAVILEWIHEYDINDRDQFCETEALKYKEPYEKQYQEIEKKEAQDFETAYQNQVKYLKAKKKAEDVNK